MSKSIENMYSPLWKDRKRVMGMPLSFTKYAVTTDRLITSKGFFRTETDEILLYRILDIKLIRKFSQKLFGVGTIILYCADKSHGTIEISNIKKPESVRMFFSKIVEQERTAKGITGRELYGTGAAADFRDTDGDGIPD